MVINMSFKHMNTSDLQQFRTVIEEVLEEKLESKLEEKLESKLAPIRQDIDELKQTDQVIIGYLNQVIPQINDNIKELQVSYKKLEITTQDIQSTVGQILDVLETNISQTNNHEKRIKRVEKHLDLPPVSSN